MSKIIGQRKNLMTIESWKRNDRFPRFIIIIGDIGSGRFTLANTIVSSLNSDKVVIDNSVSNIREVITNSYKIKDGFCYIIKDIDEMSINAKNSILKVVEEPPNQAYFIMTAKNKYFVPDTIISRAFCLTVQPYTNEQLKCFNDDEKIINYCTTPGECLNIDLDKLKEIICLNKDIIRTLESGKGSGLIKYFRKFDKEFDYNLFWKVFNKEIMSSNELVKKSYLNNFSKDIDLCIKSKSINSKMCLETFILNIYNNIKSLEVPDGTN